MPPAGANLRERSRYIIENAYGVSPAVAMLRGTDAGFETRGCGHWVLISPEESTLYFDTSTIGRYTEFNLVGSYLVATSRDGDFSDIPYPSDLWSTPSSYWERHALYEHWDRDRWRWNSPPVVTIEYRRTGDESFEPLQDGETLELRGNYDFRVRPYCLRWVGAVRPYNGWPWRVISPVGFLQLDREAVELAWGSVTYGGWEHHPGTGPGPTRKITATFVGQHELGGPVVFYTVGYHNASSCSMQGRTVEQRRPGLTSWQWCGHPDAERREQLCGPWSGERRR